MTIDKLIFHQFTRVSSVFENWLTTTTIVLRPFVRDYPGEPVPEETLTHPPSWSSSNLYQLLPSTTIHSILLVQITCLAIFLHLSMSSLVYFLVWSSPPHIPYISSPNQCFLFATHAHTWLSKIITVISWLRLTVFNMLFSHCVSCRTITDLLEPVFS